jgi:hypothetical protein
MRELISRLGEQRCRSAIHHYSQLSFIGDGEVKQKVSLGGALRIIVGAYAGHIALPKRHSIGRWCGGFRDIEA